MGDGSSASRSSAKNNQFLYYTDYRSDDVLKAISFFTTMFDLPPAAAAAAAAAAGAAAAAAAAAAASAAAAADDPASLSQSVTFWQYKALGQAL